MAAERAPSAAEAPERSMGTWPARRNFFWNQPLMPGVLKYSAFATNVTRRGSVSGMNSQSAYDRWLLAGSRVPRRGCAPLLDVRAEDDPEDGPIATHFRNQ